MTVALAGEYKDLHHLKRPGSAIQVEKIKLLQSVQFISRLLKFEYIYKPAPDIEDNFDLTLQTLRKQRVLSINLPTKSKGEEQITTSGVTDSMDDNTHVDHLFKY